MSGSDFRFWLEGIWYDLTNLGTADLPSLFFRLVLLLLVVFFGAFFLRVALTVLGGLARSYVLPVVQLVWDVLAYPVRLPFRITRRVWRRVQDGRRYRAALARERQLREKVVHFQDLLQLRDPFAFAPLLLQPLQRLGVASPGVLLRRELSKRD